MEKRRGNAAQNTGNKRHTGKIAETDQINNLNFVVSAPPFFLFSLPLAPYFVDIGNPTFPM